MEYDDVLKMIKESEKRVDEVLKAAKLDRHERQPMSQERLAMILNYVVGTIAMVFGFVLLAMVIYFMGS